MKAEYLRALFAVFLLFIILGLVVGFLVWDDGLFFEEEALIRSPHIVSHDGSATPEPTTENEVAADQEIVPSFLEEETKSNPDVSEELMAKMKAALALAGSDRRREAKKVIVGVKQLFADCPECVPKWLEFFFSLPYDDAYLLVEAFSELDAGVRHRIVDRVRGDGRENQLDFKAIAELIRLDEVRAFYPTLYGLWREGSPMMQNLAFAKLAFGGCLTDEDVYSEFWNSGNPSIQWTAMNYCFLDSANESSQDPPPWNMGRVRNFLDAAIQAENPELVMPVLTALEQKAFSRDAVEEAIIGIEDRLSYLKARFSDLPEEKKVQWNLAFLKLKDVRSVAGKR